MSYLMRQRKPFPPIGTVLANRDNSSIASTNDARLTTFELSISDTRAEMKGNRFKVDLTWLRDSQFLEQAFRWRKACHD
jgi:hypothetical protein